MPIIKSTEGKIYRIHTDQLQEVTLEELQQEITYHEQMLNHLRSLMPPVIPQDQSQVPAPVPPTDQVQTPVPPQTEQPAPINLQ